MMRSRDDSRARYRLANRANIEGTRGLTSRVRAEHVGGDQAMFSENGRKVR